MSGKRIRHSPKTQNDEPRLHFNLFDLLRILGGVLFFNALLSYFITGSATWGYHGKYVDLQFYRFLTSYPFQSHIFTEVELSKYSGDAKGLPIYLGVNGTVFDVSFKRDLYEPGGSYHLLAGRDASRVFVTGCLQKMDEYTHDLRGLDSKLVEVKLRQWYDYFDGNPHYWVVGEVIHDELVGDAPSECLNGAEFPY